MKRALTIFALLIGFINLSGQVIIPTPESFQTANGYFKINRKAIYIYIEDKEKVSLDILQTHILTQQEIRFTTRKNKADIRLMTQNDGPTESYQLSITPRHIEIQATDKAGFVYAFQTLRQLQEQGKTTWKCATIYDRPRMKWRGFMLDSGRQYQSVATIKKYIDMASMLKMNVFHWHLTEGLGWRIEIKKHPLLTQKGAFVGTGEEQQGFYTQDQIREIVEYAEKRAVTIVPEIDMPGHAEAALASYPELGCFGESVEIPKQGFTHHIFCAGKDHTLQVLKEVLDEVCDLFPSPYIHLGGDEAPKNNWNKCPDCQQRIANLGLKNSHDLQLWFSAEMTKHLKDKGKQVIFWGDVLYQTGYPLPDNVIVQWWNYRGHQDLALRNALKLGIPVICSTNYYNYLNFPVSAWRGYQENRTFDIRDAYERNPSYHAIQEGNPLIWGMTCTLWTDDGVTESMIDERLFPRILALAEQMWHNKNLVPFEEFYQRIYKQKIWFHREGYQWGPAMREE